MLVWSGCVLIRQQLFRHTRGRTWAGEDGKKSVIVSPRACGDELDTDARDARTVNIFYGTDYLGREATSVFGPVILTTFGCVWRRNSSL